MSGTQDHDKIFAEFKFQSFMLGQKRMVSGNVTGGLFTTRCQRNRVLLICLITIPFLVQVGANQLYRRILDGRAGSTKEIEFSSQPFQSDCSYALFYNGYLFNSNGTSVYNHNSEYYPPIKFARTSVKSKHIFDNIVVSLRLHNLTGGDSGYYSCSFACPSSNTPPQQYQLVVFSPPEPASCYWSSEESGLSYVRSFGEALGSNTLKCYAVQGHPKGMIACYTWDCETLGSYIRVYSPVYTTGQTNISAYFWIDNVNCIDCCSSSDILPKTRETCLDYRYSPPDKISTPVATPIKRYPSDAEISPSGQVEFSKNEDRDSVKHGGKSYTEGERAEFFFKYYLDDTTNLSVSLYIHGRQPFYKNGSIQNTGLSTSQQRRFKVDEIYKQHALEVKVTITNVSQEDVFSYYCEVYKGDKKIAAKRLRLAIHFPQGKAICKIVPHVIDTGGIWDILQCTASVGLQLGYFECYQNGERVPPFTVPVQNTTMVIQDIWMKRSVPIFCCSSSLSDQKSKCSCTDFYLDPIGNHIASEATSKYLETDDINDGSPTRVTLTKPTSDDNLDTVNESAMCTTDHADIVKLIFQAVTVGMLTYIIYLMYITLSIQNANTKPVKVDQ